MESFFLWRIFKLQYQPFSIVLEGGGFRNAYASSVLIELKHILKEFRIPDAAVSSIYACSSATGLATFFLCDQIEKTPKIWTDILTSPEIFDFKKILRRQRPLDVHALVENGTKNLDDRMLSITKTKYVINVVRKENAEVEYHVATPQNWKILMKASCALPLFANPICIEGTEYIDGGIADPFPVLKAHTDGNTKLLAISNREEGWRIPIKSYSWQGRILLREHHIRSATLAMMDRYEKTLSFLEKPPAGTDVLVIQPKTKLPVGKFTKDKKAIKAAINHGLEVIDEQKENIINFLRA